MRTTFGRFGALTCLAAVLVAAAVGSADANSAAPAPCEGSGALADPKGDAQYSKAYAYGTPLDPMAPDSYDVRQVFLTFGTGADGKKQLKANLVVENLDGTQIDEPWSAQIRYSVEINVGGEYIRPTAISEDGEFSYMYYTERVAPPAGNPRYLTEADTTGSAVPGPMGVVTIDLPAEFSALVKPGDKVDANGYSWAHTGTSAGGTLVDYAPDDRSFKSMTITECTAGATPTQTGGGNPAATPTPSGGQPSQPSQPGQPAQPGQAPAQQKPATTPPAKKKQSCAAKAKKKFKGAKNKKKLKKALKKCKKAKKR